MSQMGHRVTLTAPATSGLPLESGVGRLVPLGEFADQVGFAFRKIETFGYEAVTPRARNRCILAIAAAQPGRRRSHGMKPRPRSSRAGSWRTGTMRAITRSPTCDGPYATFWPGFME